MINLIRLKFNSDQIDHIFFRWFSGPILTISKAIHTISGVIFQVKQSEIELVHYFKSSKISRPVLRTQNLVEISVKKSENPV